MRPGALYKHIHNTDVAIYVTTVYAVPEKSKYRLRVRWMNVVNPKNWFDMGQVEVVCINYTDSGKWKEIE